MKNLTLTGFFHFSSNSSFAVSRNSLTACYKKKKGGKRQENINIILITIN